MFSIPFTLRVYEPLSLEYYFSLIFILILIALSLPREVNNMIKFWYLDKKNFRTYAAILQISLSCSETGVRPLQRKSHSNILKKDECSFCWYVFYLSLFLTDIGTALVDLFFLKISGFWWHLTWKILALGIETCSSCKQIKTKSWSRWH